MSKNLAIEGAKIVIKNFGGNPDKYNSTGGKRYCCIAIDKDMADDLIRDGWNVKQFKSTNDPDYEPGYYLQLKVRYEKFPPNIYLVTRHGKKLLTEATVGELDYADIDTVDIVINGSEYDVNGKQGISAYVKNMYVTVIEDQFADKYRFDDME